MLLILFFSINACYKTQDKNFDERFLNRIENEAVVLLGKELFFEKLLSSSSTISCASCHKPEFAFADSLRFSIGQNDVLTERNTPSIIGRPLNNFQFWDGRAASLYKQVFHPFENPKEMGNKIEDACERICNLKKYKLLFERAYHSEEITPELLSTAITAFLSTLKFNSSEFQKLEKEQKLPTNIINGKNLFFGKAKCSKCHTGESFTDERFHNTGISFKSNSGDIGRENISGRTEDRRAFKTPTLKELTYTAPYMHNGSLQSLEEVIDHYINAKDIDDPQIDPIINHISLSKKEQDDLLKFLISLSSI